MKFYHILYDIPVPGDGFNAGNLKNKARGEFCITAISEADALEGLKAALRQAFKQEIAVEVLRFDEKVDLTQFAWTAAARNQVQSLTAINEVDL